MDYKRFNLDKYGLQISFFDIFFIAIDERAGRTFAFYKDCAPWPPIYHNPPLTHVQQIYLQLGRWSLIIAWKSNKCDN